ncbi:MAG: sigma-70 family RNA polymerase sigma factor [Chloroflexota bacterium]|nr:MAG: sigma-70 family RNA polymerase sigma factor [Chloroflexota bacterium]
MLDELVAEYAHAGVGSRLYGEIVSTVRAVVMGRRYPPSYSPTGRWDADALSALAHDWTTDKLLRYGQLEQLLVANTSRRGLRRGLELSFTDFLVGRKKRTALDNLFNRANTRLESEAHFRVFAAGSKATRLWGLTEWKDPRPFQGPETELVAAGLRPAGFTAIRYRDDARKLSPVVLDRELSEFIDALFREVGGLLSLGQMAVVFRWRFDLFDATMVGLDEPTGPEQDGYAPTVAETLPGGRTPEAGVVTNESASAIVRNLTPRQQRALLEYARPGATYTTVAERLDCSKSTVENEVRRALQLIASESEGPDDAEDTFARVLDLLSDG